MAYTVGEQLIDVLYSAGVRRIYGLVGDSLNPIVDAVRRKENFEWIHVHNEEAAAFAAGAEAQITGEIAVCAGSCGPGNTHLIQGLYDADRSGAPVLALASQIPSYQIGTSYFQETHPEQLFSECSHYCEMINSPAQMPRLLQIAMQTALSHGGVAVLSIPGDIPAQSALNQDRSARLTTGDSVQVPARKQVERLAAILNEASTVTLFAGAGVRDAREQVLALAETLKAPIGHTLRGKEWIQYENPFDVGMSGLLGYGACYEAMHQAEVLILLGTDFPYDAFLPDSRTVQVDRDASVLGRRTPLELGIVGDVGATLDALLPLLTEKPDRTFLDRLLEQHASALERVVDTYTRKIETMRPIHPEYLAAQLDDLASEDTIFTVDTGMCNVWAARYLTPNGKRRVIGSFLHGSMANALPQAIGAQIAQPERQVISLSGDGGLSMLMGELLTAQEQELPITVVVFNNGSLGMIRLEMMVSGYPYFGTEHGAADYGAIAAACGLHATTVTDPADVRSALREALAHHGPSLVDVRTDPNALSLPPHVTGQQVRGFALAATRTVLDGGVGRMVDLARSNLRNINIRR